MRPTEMIRKIESEIYRHRRGEQSPATTTTNIRKLYREQEIRPKRRRRKSRKT